MAIKDQSLGGKKETKEKRRAKGKQLELSTNQETTIFWKTEKLGLSVIKLIPLTRSVIPALHFLFNLEEFFFLNHCSVYVTSFKALKNMCFVFFPFIPQLY